MAPSTFRSSAKPASNAASSPSAMVIVATEPMTSSARLCPARTGGTEATRVSRTTERRRGIDRSGLIENDFHFRRTVYAASGTLSSERVDRSDRRALAAPVVTSLFARVDHLVIAVRDLDAAAAAYATVLGRSPSWRGTHPTYGTANVLFGLANCYVELLAPAGAPAVAHPLAQTLAAALERQPESLFALALGSTDLVASVAGLRAAGVTTT